MTSSNAVEQCRIAYEKLFERNFTVTDSLEQAADSCSHLYLDGKPKKNDFTHQVRTTALWQCSFWQKITDTGYQSDPISLALGRSLHFGLVDEKLFRRLLQTETETLKRGIRYSRIFLQPDSPSWTTILSIADDGDVDFHQFIKICQILYEELHQHDNQILDLKKDLDELTIFEYLLYGSLFTFQNLVPEKFESPKKDDGYAEMHQRAWDALSELLIWKLKSRPENDLRLNERFLAKSLKQHLMPLLLPGEIPPSLCLRNLDRLNVLIAAVATRNDFLHGTVYDFCYDDDYRYLFEGDHLTIYPVEIPEESEWDFNGRKLSALHSYWFNRALLFHLQSDLATQQFGLPENDDSNRLAHIKACQVFLQLDEVFGLRSEIVLPDGSKVNLFKAIHSLELMTAFFNSSYIAKFQEYLQETGNWIPALSQLMFEGLVTGENRFPLTWAEPSEKAERIKSWTVSDTYPDGDLRMAANILEFWTNDLKELRDSIDKAPNVPTPEFHEQPIIKLGMFGFQLPWLMASQNNSTAAVNNLRRIGCRRKGRTDETHRIESRLGDMFRSKGFYVLESYQADVEDGYDPGEIDLICHQDGHILILEVKSSYLRKTKQEAWIHRTITLRKAAQQLQRKKIAIQKSILYNEKLQSELQLRTDINKVKVYPWIVDTSIEHDQELIDGFLKVSLEGLIVILRNERQLLGRNLLLEKEVVEDDLFPDGFSVQRFVEIVEKGKLWDPLAKRLIK